MGENENKGLFDLNNLESSKIDDLMELHIFDEDAIKEDTNIPVPGGDKETPTAKPHDAASISIPAKKDIPVDAYNDMLIRLKKSYKESCQQYTEIIDQLLGLNPVPKSIDEYQMEEVEIAMGDAALIAFENGPYYEAVTREDKEAVKTIVGKLRSKVKEYLKKDGNRFYQPNVIARLLFSGLHPTKTASAIHQLIATKLWQVLGIANIDSGKVNDITSALTDEFSEELGEYKILSLKTIPGITEFLVQKLGTDKDTFFLLVDKKLPSELKELQKEIESNLKKDDKKDEKKKGKNINEKKEEDEDDDEDKKKEEKKEEKEEKEKEDKK
jgi:hypothetical protein